MPIRPKAHEVSVGHDELTVLLDDGRRICVPLAWFPRLFHATTYQRRIFELLGDGEGIRWPAIDEDLSVAGLLRGPAQGLTAPAGLGSQLNVG